MAWEDGKHNRESQRDKERKPTPERGGAGMESEATGRQIEDQGRDQRKEALS